MGEWVQLRPEIWDTVVTPCDCCGQVVARQLWVADVEGVQRRFCSTRCEALYRTYVVPQTRAADRP